MNLRNRVEGLEGRGGGNVLIFWRHHRQTKEQALDHWRLEHSGDAIEAVGRSMMVGGWQEPGAT